MGEMTMCNHCTLDWMKRRHGVLRLTVEGRSLRVARESDGKFLALFGALTTECAC